MTYDEWKTTPPDEMGVWVERGCPGCNPDLLHDDVAPCDEDCARSRDRLRRRAAIQGYRDAIAENELLIARYIVEGGSGDQRIAPCRVRLGWLREQLETREAAQRRDDGHGEEAA